MSQHKLTSIEIQCLQEAVTSDYKIAGIRLREGEYQYELSKAIASFQLEFYLPNVKDLIKKIHGEDKADDVQLIRKTQTVLKKMEKSGVTKILPKTKPWELQRYALSSFKFIDIEKNRVSFATDEQIKLAIEKIKSVVNQQNITTLRTNSVTLCILAFMTTICYIVMLWSIMQPTINPVIFAATFPLSILCSIMLGKVLSKTT
ncbi:hypothetical protein KEJ37_07865 [Candidatus Bathyarchaeota archaeon]|nr:hypothetical protein [Candidatus Bathyarchaeota archaeon]